MTDFISTQELGRCALKNNYGLVKITVPQYIRGDIEVPCSELRINTIDDLAHSNNFVRDTFTYLRAGSVVFYMYSEDEDFGMYFTFKNNKTLVLDDDGTVENMLTDFPSRVLTEPEDNWD